MKRKCLIWALVLISCVLFLQTGCQEQAKPAEESLTAQTKPEAAPEPGKPLPRITFENIVYDFGEVGPNRKNTGQIKFTNTGEALLKITKVAKCCGVVTRLGKMEYEPGESGTLKVEWNSGPRQSTMRRKLTIHSNDPMAPQTILSLTAKVVLQVDWEPKSLRLFLDEENAGCPKITINSLDNQPFSILEFKSTADCITADYDSSVEATKFILEPRVNIEAMPKNFKGRININLTHPEGKTAAILFSMLPKYTVRPSMIIIWDAEPEKPIVRKVDLLNNYRKDFEIESVSSKGGIIGIKVLEQRKITNGYQLDVELTPPAAENKTNFKDELFVNIKDGEKLAIRCNGRYSKIKPKPEIQ
ncbi:MAG TPA: DUF1573 domain-containing protein [Sedimentisphaerales bacterium]|nr:DUF1573 domain-containing protein [Sedimentisphaerales bacterium]